MWVADFWKAPSQLFDRRRASGGQGNQAPKEGRNFRTESQNYTHHKITSLWDHDMLMDNWKFGPHNAKKIIEYLQTTYGKYAKYNAAKSFVFRTIKKHKDAQRTGNLRKDPMRDRRGENRRSTKRKDAAIIALCDELLDLNKATAPKVQKELRNRGINISVSTVRRIASDLNYLWTKPWHTDILTPAQKMKRKIFCANLLRLSEEELSTILHSGFSPTRNGGISSVLLHVSTKNQQQNRSQGSKSGNFLCKFLYFVHLFFAMLPSEYCLFLFCFLGSSQQKQKRRCSKACLLLGWHFLVGQDSWRRLDGGQHESVLATHKKCVCWHPVRRRWRGI